jgi:hypothetical protein
MILLFSGGVLNNKSAGLTSQSAFLAMISQLSVILRTPVNKKIKLNCYTFITPRINIKDHH